MRYPRLSRDSRGTVLIEFALAGWVLLMLTFGIMEFAIAMWQFNLVSKGAFDGVRQAVQSTAVSGDVLAWSGVENGELAPGADLAYVDGNGVVIYQGIGPFTLTCTRANAGTGCACTGTGCTELRSASVSETSATRLARMNRIVDAVRIRAPDGTFVADWVDPDAVYVEYQHIGQGFAGRPGADIVPLVTVGVRNMTYDFLVLDGFGLGLDSLPMGEFRTSLPAEDLDTQGPG